MQRLKIHIGKPGEAREHTVVLGRLGSLLVGLVALVLVVAVVVASLIFGYLVLGMVFAALLAAFVIAMIRSAFHSLRR